VSRITFITGGVKSAKSSFALEFALKYKKPRIFIATAVAFDDEMKKRIENHRLERGFEFETIEEPVELSNAIKKADGNICIIDCITVWINNLLYYNRLDEIEKFTETLKNPPSDVVIVSNEVGMGIMPDNKLSRQYADILGKTNQKIANLADNVVFMISGIPLYIKKGGFLNGAT
jgi:adenosylcobinamide kinase/adenosylcobinamide-phosphate guanylyltransferase